MNTRKIELITVINSDEYNAGPKAPKDIIHIVKEKFGENFIEKTLLFPNESRTKIIKRILINFETNIKIIQYPVSLNFEIMNIINCKYAIAFIHDLPGLRYQNEKAIKKEIKLLKKYRAIIVHNQKMKEYLVSNGIEASKIFSLELFDYLCISSTNKINKTDDISVVYAGNLKKEKCPFIYQLDEKLMNNFNLNIYGQGIEKFENKKIQYCGAFNPEELPNNFNGKLGLVWDGNYDESDEINGEYKNYTKYNNPHKLSCYLAADMPVIAWEKAAISEFIVENNIGYVIGNLYDINNIDFSDYNTKKKNAQKIGKRIRNGYYTTNVLEKIIHKIEK